MNTCATCKHFTADNKCGDTALLISRSPGDPACNYYGISTVIEEAYRCKDSGAPLTDAGLDVNEV